VRTPELFWGNGGRNKFEVRKRNIYKFVEEKLGLMTVSLLHSE
jgi:hypothetical protein